MDENSIAYLMSLCQAEAPSGFEREVAKVMKERIAPYVDSISNDRLGSMVFEKRGSGSPKILFASHMDEIGFLITSINDQGFLTFTPLGGWFDQVLLGQRVRIMAKAGGIDGVIASKPPHVLDPEERKKVVTKDKMFIDIGCTNKKEVEEMGVRVGDPVVPVSEFTVTAKRRFKDGEYHEERQIATGKAMDDRIGCFLTSELVRQLAESGTDHPNVVIGAGTVQEEVGLRGARTVANLVKPDVCIILDTDISGDVPGISPQQAPGRMGEGVSIAVYDRSMIPNQPLKELAIGLAEKNGIPYQLSHVVGGGTDGGSVHLSNVGCPTLVFNISTRHIHSHLGMIDLKDAESSLRLCVEMVKALDERTVRSLTEV
jgi:putative aminopeptidase FrvX